MLTSSPVTVPIAAISAQTGPDSSTWPNIKRLGGNRVESATSALTEMLGEGEEGEEDKPNIDRQIAEKLTETQDLLTNLCEKY